MKWVLIVVAVLAGLVALVAIVGALLPVSHVASRAVRLPRPPAAVWAVVTDFANAASWRSDLERVEMLPDREGRPAFREHGDNGEIAMQVDELHEPDRMVVRIADPDLPFGGTWTWELTADGDGTKVTVTERGEVKNPIFRFMSKFVFGHTATLERVLADLGKKVGET
jgi:uncharacterized protein YndB with AHSA1/START domain